MDVALEEAGPSMVTSVEQMRHFEQVKTLHRGEDPQTSVEAAERAVTSGRNVTNQLAVLEVLLAHPDSTGKELAEILRKTPGRRHIDRTETSRRISDLKRTGFIEAVGRTPYETLWRAKMNEKISVEERLPELWQVVVLWEDGEAVIGSREETGEDEWGWFVARSVPYWDKDQGIWLLDDADEDDLHPTHWSPLPGEKKIAA